MSLPEEVERAFDPGGVLAAALPRFSARAGQLAMAREVARAMQAGGVLVVEAGTGVGKTFAYLVPALLGGKRVLLSTATKALQDQLFLRDIPKLRSALGLPVRVAILKGRSSYLCAHRLSLARQMEPPLGPHESRMLSAVEVWATHSLSGDLAEVPEIDERSALIGRVTSTRENCLGARCPVLSGCYVNQARRQAMLADVVVINHHLFFADLQVRESGVAELLPTVHSVVFDEAHQLNEIGVQFLGTQLSTGQLLGFARDLAQCVSLQARGLADWHTLVAALEAAVGDVRRACLAFAAGSKLRWTSAAPQGVDPSDWVDGLQQVQQALHEIQRSLEVVAPMSPDLGGLLERVKGLNGRLAEFALPTQVGYVRWLEVGAQLRMFESPLDIADAMQQRVLTPHQKPGGGKSWIFTSATLGHEPLLQSFVDACGLKGAQVMRVQSPFDYPKLGALYVPEDMVKPSDTGHTKEVALLAAQGAQRLGGRTMVLTTTLRAMRSIGQMLREQEWSEPGMDILVQGEHPKRELLERFTQVSASNRSPCILVASASFWEGIDIAGDALQLLVIDKIPFAPPDDPLVEARALALLEQGKNPFQFLHLPQAALALKQGAGRLIRSEADRGVLVVCDTRLKQMGYGRKLLAAMPPMRTLGNAQEFYAALDALTTPSTMDLN
jgi:ATP-dependent DNA helicase DinG